MKIQTLRQSLQKTTKANLTVKAVTDRLIEELTWAAEDGMSDVECYIPKEVAYEVLANLTNEHCALSCICIDEEQSRYEVNWEQ